MRPTAQKKIKKVTVKKTQKTLRISWKNLFQFFIVIPVVTIIVIEGSHILVSQADASNNNQQINFQGKIVNKTGGINITDGTYSFTFKIYDASTAGNQLWTETQSSVTVTNGIFQVSLGSVTSLTSLNFTNPNLWLDITFNGENFGSRIRLGAVPTAIDALNLDGIVATQSASGFNLAGGTSTVSTVSFTTSGSTLTIQPGNTGALIVQSNGANALTLDTGSGAAINIGNNNASSVTIGNNSPTNNTAITLTTGGSGSLTLGSNNGIGNVVVQPNGGGNAALIINDQGAGSLLTASASGVTKFTVSNVGDVTAGKYNKVTITTPATGSTLTIADGKTLTVSDSTTLNTNTITFGGGETLTLTSNKSLSFADAFTTSGNFPLTLITTGSTNVTLPTSGTLVNSAVTTLSSLTTVGSLVSGTVIGTDTFTTNTMTDSGALTLATNSNGNLTLSPNGTGDTIISSNANSGLYIGSTSNTPAVLSVSGGIANNAAFIVNNINSGDLMTASASGVTKFRLSNAGGILVVGGQASDVDTLTAATLTIGGNTQNGLTLGRSGAATTINGSGLTIGPTSWTTTPTISGLITATLGVSVAVGQSYTGSGAVTLSSGAGTALTIDSGTTGALNIGTGANGKTITIGNSTANTALTFTTGGTGLITLGSNTGVGNIFMQPNAGGQAALIINKQATTGDLITASASGTTRFRMTNSGGILFQGDITASIGSGASGNGSNAVANVMGDQGSLVPNAGFESVIASSLADGWFPAATTSAGIFSRDTTTPAKGSASLMATLINSTAAIYSTCIPVSGAAGQYALNYYAKASSTKMSVISWVDGYTSKANCQSDTSPTLSLVKSITPSTSWTVTGSGTTAVSSFGTTSTWVRIHFLFSCTSSCNTSTTGEIDGVRLTESTTGQGLDYAENYPTDRQNPATAADVVALKPGGPVATVIPATNQMDGVIGVVSSNPGETLDDGSVTSPKVPVALAGRIPTKVSTENGPIHMGDYLIASDLPGVAVKAISAGQVVGIALEDYTSSDPTQVGTIVMFVKNTYYSGTNPLVGAGAGLASFIGPPEAKSSISSPASSNAASVIPVSSVGSVSSLYVDGLATISGTLRVKTNGLFEGILTVLDTLTTNNFIVNGVSDFFDNVVFHKGVQFTTTPTFSKNTAGFAVIHKGAKSVDVVFATAYAKRPIVQVSLTTHTTQDATASAQTLLAGNYAFVITNESGSGFTIVLNKAAVSDVYFSWITIAVDTPGLSESDSETTVLGVQTTPSPTLTLIPTSMQSATGSGK